MVANFVDAIWICSLISMSPVLGSFWEICEPRYLNSVEFLGGTLRKLIIVSGYSSSRRIWFRIIELLIR